MDDFIEIEISTSDQQQSEIIIAELSEMAEGFRENDKSLSVFIRKNNFDEEAVKEFLTPFKLSYTKTIIPEINWNEKWESEFEPVIIENFVAVRASFHPPARNVKHDIIITPKMSFGTGHHATTYLMLQEMRDMDLKNKTVLDFGTGTGVLAIMAKKLGAKKVVAIDIDEWSIQNAKENFEENSFDDIELIQTSKPPPGHFDIILCNINLNGIIINAEKIKSTLSNDYQLLISGILTSDGEIIRNKFEKLNIPVIKMIQRDGWLCMLLTSL